MRIERSPKTEKRRRDWEKRYDKRAKRMSGPVVVRYVCPICGGAHAKSDHNDEAPPPHTG
jgi:hypothetical protein